jgi:hypothetical protein
VFRRNAAVRHQVGPAVAVDVADGLDPEWRRKARFVLVDGILLSRSL